MVRRPASNSRRAPALLLLLIAAAGASATRAAAQPAASLARHVPADVTLFVELGGDADLLIPLTDAHVWSTLAELAGQPASADDAAEWRRRVNHTLLMEPDEAIRLLFSRGVAFIAGDGPAPESALLCRLAPGTTLLELATRWQARPIPFADKAAVYQLRNGIGLGAFDDRMIFGDPGPESTLFPALLRSIADEPVESLADDEQYRSLLRRVPDRPDGVLFTRLAPRPAPRADTQSTTTAPAEVRTAAAIPPRPLPALRGVTDLPGPFRGSTSVLLALHRKAEILQFTAVGDAPAQPRREDDADAARLIERLPERTLLAWGGVLDHTALLRAADSLPAQNLIRVAVGTQAQPLGRLTAALTGSTAVAIGTVPARDGAPAPALPAAAVLLRARDAQAAEDELTRFLQSLVSVYNLLSLRAGLPLLEASSDLTIAGSAAHAIDFTPLAQSTLGEAYGRIELTWARDDDVLIVASHADWLRQILEARKGRRADLSRVTRLGQRPPSPASETLIVAHLGPIADLCADWLTHFEQAQPQVLREDYWRIRQPGPPRLGINVAQPPEQRRLEVVSLERGAAAAGLVRPGDWIVGAEGRRFSTAQPVAEFREAITQRRNSRRVELLVERSGVMTPVSIHVEFLDPVSVLRRLRALGTIAQRVVYHDDRPDGAGPRGFLTVELRASRARLFSFQEPPAVVPAAPDDR
ncbi:MAG: hypothetical protein HRU75_13915 [Planctomycetia bacterium]|nr:MAG: hypothetical protein HRU75_13915 [Planctomycetia bacterium]